MYYDPIGTLLGPWAGELSLGSIILRPVLAILLAALIGCERATKRHAAGLRTFMLVSLASSTAMMVDIMLMNRLGAILPLMSAATVIAAAIISSNSILFSSKNQIKGLTTSAGLWASAIIGATSGAGLYTVTLIGFVALICCLSWFPRIEMYLKNRSDHFEIHLELANRQSLQDFTAMLRKLGLRIDDIEANPAYANSGLAVYTVSLTVVAKELKKYKTHREIIEALGSPEYVYYVEEMM
ncbi:MAG: MgtC/SapB family protein [Ruminococcaceae bacterium]|nr:MgtC/SapB family protein [Oscillospiraceae bacterium]